MNGGEVILADEPTGALDSRSGEEVMAILHQLKAQGHTVIIVTHDPQVAAQAERIIELRDGEIVRNPPPSSSEKGGVLRAEARAEPSVWRQFSSGFREALVMARRAMAANKNAYAAYYARHHYWYRFGGLYCGGWRCGETTGLSRYSRYRHQYHRCLPRQRFLAMTIRVISRR